MTLLEYKKQIDKLVKQGHGNKTVIYAVDEEGNEYKAVYNSPCILPYDDICDIAYDVEAKDSNHYRKLAKKNRLTKRKKCARLSAFFANLKEDL